MIYENLLGYLATFGEDTELVLFADGSGYISKLVEGAGPVRVVEFESTEELRHFVMLWWLDNLGGPDGN